MNRMRVVTRSCILIRTGGSLRGNRSGIRLLQFSQRCFASSSSSTKETARRPFKILGVQQIAVGSKKEDPLMHLWYNIFGLQAEETGIQLPKENAFVDIFKLGADDKTAVEIHLMSPIEKWKHPRVREFK